MGSKSTAHRFRFLIVAIATVAVTAPAACVATGAQPEPTATSSITAERGRVEIRKGEFLRGTEFGDANFSAILPNGWDSADAPQYVVKGHKPFPTGALGKPGEVHMSVDYSFRRPGSSSLHIFAGSPQQQLNIDGVPVTISAPSDSQISRGSMRFDAAFPWLPGDEEKRFALLIEARGISNMETVDELKAIVRSIRYAPPPNDASNNPMPQVLPEQNWTRVHAHPFRSPDQRVFSVLAPPGWRFEPHAGFDSFPGTFTDGKISIHFDYGSLSSPPTGYRYYLTNPEGFREHDFWVEHIGGKPFVMFQPVRGQVHDRGYTGTTVSRIPGLKDIELGGIISSAIYSCGGSFWSHTENPDDQHLVLAILRTIRAERQQTECR